MLADSDGTEPDVSKDAIDSAWASLHESRRRRHTMHDVVRAIARNRRVVDDFDVQIGESMDPRWEGQ
jgi:hypothetical protein